MIQYQMIAHLFFQSLKVKHDKPPLSVLIVVRQLKKKRPRNHDGYGVNTVNMVLSIGTAIGAPGESVCSCKVSSRVDD